MWPQQHSMKQNELKEIKTKHTVAAISTTTGLVGNEAQNVDLYNFLNQLSIVRNKSNLKCFGPL